MIFEANWPTPDDEPEFLPPPPAEASTEPPAKPKERVVPVPPVHPKFVDRYRGTKLWTNQGKTRAPYTPPWVPIRDCHEARAAWARCLANYEVCLGIDPVGNEDLRFYRPGDPGWRTHERSLFAFTYRGARGAPPRAEAHENPGPPLAALDPVLRAKVTPMQIRDDGR